MLLLLAVEQTLLTIVAGGGGVATSSPWEPRLSRPKRAQLGTAGGGRVEWVQKLYEPYVRRTFKWEQRQDITGTEWQQRFERIFSESIITVLVQEPWHGTVRFKGLAQCYADESGDLIADPMAYLSERYGGGKFKLNFHHGWNFVSTINFKSQGVSKWYEMPSLDY